MKDGLSERLPDNNGVIVSVKNELPPLQQIFPGTAHIAGENVQFSDVTMFPVSVVASVEINKRYYFQIFLHVQQEKYGFNTGLSKIGFLRNSV